MRMILFINLFCGILIIHRYNATYTVIIPLVSPLFDIIDTTSLSYTLQFYHDYYTQAGK